MVGIFTIGTVAGILLGLRFKVFALGPAILIATVAIVLTGHGLRLIVFTEVGTVILLQIGYMGGAFFQPCSRLSVFASDCAMNQRDQSWHIEKT